MPLLGEGSTVARDGLTAEEVEERRRNGEVNDVPATHTRTLSQILRANILTPFNALLGGLLAVILVVGPLQDALFGVVLVANSVTGILQELRAKHTLDRLTVLTAPRARIVRAGAVTDAPVAEVVLDDVLEMRPGDQIVVDGEVLEERGLEIDESLVTGESEPIAKRVGSDVLSGTFVAAGSGRYRATKVGKDAYARAIAEEARRFTLVTSELRAGIDQIIRLVGWAMIPTASLLLFSQLRSHAGLSAALRGTVAGVVAMVPEGLVLLTSVAFAAGIIRLGRRKVLVQELPAVETLARVDVVCLDKTGTITSGDIDVETVIPLDESDAGWVLTMLAGIEPDPNATLSAIREAYPGYDGTVALRSIPFSSARKWSGADFGDRGVWVLGAPEILLARTEATVDAAALSRRVEDRAAAGRRVLLLCEAPALPAGGASPPAGLRPAALILLMDRIRPEAPHTLSYFGAQRVAIKIISGDHPRTVASVAERAGVPNADRWIDARELPDEPALLADAMDEHTVFGRVSPQRKRAMITAMQGRGHVVAMTGDGVNDVLALKDADIGIAMGSGSSAARGVSQLVLLDDSFASMPPTVAEGRRVINNMEKVATLFLTKTVYSMLLALAIGVVHLPFPFLPRHLTLIGSLTIGIPAFFLALAPNSARARSGYVSRVLRFAIPTGAIAAIATFTTYFLVETEDDFSTAQEKTAATLVLACIGLVVLARLSSPLTPWRRVLIASMAGAFLSILLVPGTRHFFQLSIPPVYVLFSIAGVVAVADRLIVLELHLLNRWWGTEVDGEHEERREPGIESRGPLPRPPDS